jgi:dihydrofolate reductase
MLSLIVAHSKNRVIGIENRLPWNLPSDLKYFKETTLGKTIVMGRKTFESIGKPLPGRRNVVLTSEKSWQVPEIEVIHSLDDIKNLSGEVIFIGGSTLYKQVLPIIDRMYITKIEHEFEGDAYFPNYTNNEWISVAKEKGIKDEKNRYDYYFEVYERKAKK